MKRCTKCKDVKSVSEYQSDKSRYDGLQARCKPCDKEYYKQRRARLGKEAYLPSAVDSFGETKAEREKRRVTGRRCRRCKNIYNKEIFIVAGGLIHDCPLCIEYKESEEYSEMKRIRQCENVIRYNKRHPEKVKSRYRKWQIEHRSAWHKAKMASNPEYAIGFRIRDMLARTLRKSKSIASVANAERQLGYTKKQLITHLESQFVTGMTWENRGEWHIDHIKPIVVCVKEGITDPSIVNALSNLQPLWAFDNLSKGAKYTEEN